MESRTTTTNEEDGEGEEEGQGKNKEQREVEEKGEVGEGLKLGSPDILGPLVAIVIVLLASIALVCFLCKRSVHC